MQTQLLADFLLTKAAEYNTVSFIHADPICIPHLFTKQQDIEIAGFFAALLAWGNRTSIINSCNRLLRLMNHQPYAFISQWPTQVKANYAQIEKFVHRTFNGSDLFFLCSFLHYHYSKESSLETAFSKGLQKKDSTVETALNYFYTYVFNTALHGIPFEKRTQKHIAAPFKHSACKRLNMYLRWMVRKDTTGVDFGIWKHIKPHQLICPLDVHVARVAKRFQLIQSDKADWKTAVALTTYLQQLNPTDPVLYDFALFGLGVVEKY